MTRKAPKKPCAHPSCGVLLPMGTKYCVRHHKASKQQYEKFRKSSSARGYNYQWQQARIEFLKEHALCRHCYDKGRVVAAVAVDHIVPHQGDEDKFWDRENWQALCSKCHNTKTALVDGGFGNKPAMRPRWLQPSAIPVFLVCGPPGAGKSQYVREHARPGDIIIDLDDIREKISGVRYSNDVAYLHASIRERNRMLGSLKRQHAPKRAWVTLTEPKVTHRRWWVDKLQDVQVIVLETDASICEQRIRESIQRREVADAQVTSVHTWWRNYSNSATDKVIRTTETCTAY